MATGWSEYSSASELAALIRARELSPVGAVETAVMRGEATGDLHGVPIALKDFTPTRGQRTTLGSYAYEHWVPDFDPVIWQRLRAAGAILIGKTTTPEFAHT